MFEGLAIIALAILNQCSLISADQNGSVFLGQFVSFDILQVDSSKKNDGWSFYDKNSIHESKLEALPLKTQNIALDVNAISAIAMDSGTDYVLFEKSSGRQMPIASISKLMTALVVLENSSLDETVIISPEAMQIFGDKKGLVAGERIKLEELLRLMIVDSNNAAAYALAEHTGGSVQNFVALMNQKAELLGLKDTKFFNPTGLDAKEENYSTAYDLSELTDSALDKDLIWEASRTREATFFSLDKKQKHFVHNTDELLDKMDNVFGGKTGYTIDAGQCLVLVSESADKKHRVISVVLNAQDRFAETKKIVDWVFNVYRW